MKASNIYSPQSESNLNSDRSYQFPQSFHSHWTHPYQYQQSEESNKNGFKIPPRYQKYLGVDEGVDGYQSNEYREYKHMMNEDIKSNENEAAIEKVIASSKFDENETKWDDEYNYCYDFGFDESEYNDYYDERKNNNNNPRKVGGICNNKSSKINQDCDWNDSLIVCKFYNPYFNSGCNQENYCQYAHLSLSEYIIYTGFIRKENEINLFSQRKYDDALSYIKSGYISKALNILRHLVMNHEFNAHYNFWLGRCYALCENSTFEDLGCAMFYYQKAISLQPKIASFHAYYGQFMVDIAGKKKKSIECYEYKQAKIHLLKALELKPSISYRLQYAKFLDEIEGEFFEAKKHYKIALETFPSDTRIRLNYARLLHKMGNFRASKQEFNIIFEKLENGMQQKYQSINSRWIWPHFHYAKLLVDMQYFDLAKQQFQLMSLFRF